MTLFRTSLWNGIAVATRLATGLILNKVLAVYLDPAGYAIIGQFQNAVSVAVTFSTGAIQTGVTKYTAEFGEDRERLHSLWATAGVVTLVASILMSISVALARTPLAVFFLKDAGLSSVFLWLAAGLTLISLNSLLLAMLNGRKEVKRFVVSSIAGALVGLALTAVLAWQFGLYGALVALSLNQAVVVVVTLQQTMGTAWFRLRLLWGRIDPTQLRGLGKFVLMAATTAIATPLSQILVRNHLATQFGWDAAGYWDAMWKISGMYLALLTTTLSLYYLPRISEIKNWGDLKAELVGAYKLVLPLSIATSLIVYLLRDVIINTLLTREFSGMEVLFAWQMVGDVLKISSWLIAYLMIGRSLIRMFIATEIVFALLFWGLTVAFTGLCGFEGVAIAHAITYGVYLITVYALVVSTRGRREALFR
jgi:PST family polysaccharide transporter